MNAPHPRRRTRPTTIIMAIAATSILAIGALTLAWAYGWGLGNNRAPTEAEIECSTIVHAHQTWTASAARLNNTLTPTEVDLKQAHDDTNAYYHATIDRRDAPAKNLATKVAAYDVAIGTINVALTLSGSATISQQLAAQNASTDVVTAYDRFRNETCTGTEYAG